MDDYNKGKCVYCFNRKETVITLDCGHYSCSDCRDRNCQLESQSKFQKTYRMSCPICKMSSFFIKGTLKYNKSSPSRERGDHSSYIKMTLASTDRIFQTTPPFDIGEEKYNKKQKSPTRGGVSPRTRRRSASPRDISQISLFSLKEEVKAAHRCVTHQQEFTLYCRDDKKLCCVECVFDDNIHKKHNVISIKAAMGIIAEENKYLKREAKEKMAGLDEAIDSYSRAMAALRNRKESYDQAILSHFNDLHRELEERQNAVTDKLEEFFQKKLTELDSKMNQALFIKNCIREFQSMDAIKNIESQTYTFSAYSILMKSIPNIYVEKEIYSKENLKILEFPTFSILKKQIDNFGQFFTNSCQRRSATTPSPKALKDRGLPSPRGGENLSLDRVGQLGRSYFKGEERDTYDKDLKTLKRSFTASDTSTLFFDSYIIARQDIAAQEAFFSLLPGGLKRTKKIFSIVDDGPSSSVFHAKCDKKSPYFVLIKANSFIFGYHMPIPFTKKEGEAYSDKAWIFSLVNRYGLKPLKFTVKKEKAHLALTQCKGSPCLGATTENMQDLWVNLDDPRRSLSRLGYVYERAENIESEILAGSYTDWNLEEFEVFSYEA